MATSASAALYYRVVFLHEPKLPRTPNIERRKIELGPGHRIDCEVINRAVGRESIILLNGSAFNLHQWDNILRYGFYHGLADRYQIVRYDYGGIGYSTKPTNSWDLRSIAEELSLLMDALGIKQAHLYGLSKGTMLAQIFAIRNPERVRSLAGYGWYYHNFSGLERVIKRFRRRIDRFKKIESAWPGPMDRDRFDLLWRNVYRRIVFGKIYRDFSTVDKIKNYFIKNQLYNLMAPTPIGTIYDWFDYLLNRMIELKPVWDSGIATLARLPILIQHSIHDETLPIGMARELSQILPGAKLIEYPAGFSHISIAFKRSQARAVVSDYEKYLSCLPAVLER